MNTIWGTRETRRGTGHMRARRSHRLATTSRLSETRRARFIFWHSMMLIMEMDTKNHELLIQQETPSRLNHKSSGKGQRQLKTDMVDSTRVMSLEMMVSFKTRKPFNILRRTTEANIRVLPDIRVSLNKLKAFLIRETTQGLTVGECNKRVKWLRLWPISNTNISFKWPSSNRLNKLLDSLRRLSF